MIHLPQEKVNITWQQLDKILKYHPDLIKEIERIELINDCQPEICTENEKSKV